MAMEFTATRETLLRPLQKIVGIVEHRHALPIVANVLFTVSDDQLSMLSTDLEIELGTSLCLEKSMESAQFAISARKFTDICRALPEGMTMECSLIERRFTIKAGKSRFALNTLLAQDFPIFEKEERKQSFSLKKNDLIHLIQASSFSAAQDDVRQYLNGVLLDIEQYCIRMVGTDGHRLAMSELKLSDTCEACQIIIPRKTIIELAKLLKEANEEDIQLEIRKNSFRVLTSDITLTSRLVEGRFPNYKHVLPDKLEKKFITSRDSLKQALSRVVILSNDKYRGIRLYLTKHTLRIMANNLEQEEAEEEIDIDYQDGDLNIGFNASYLLDILSAVPEGELSIACSKDNSSIVLQSLQDENSLYMVMPMKL